jgi:hypothetical protein
VALNNCGAVAQQREDWVTAGKHYDESLGLRLELLGAKPESPQAKRDLVVTLERVGMVHLQTGNVRTASPIFGECLSLAQQLSMSDPDSTAHKLLYVESLTLLAASDSSPTEGVNIRRMAWELMAKIPRAFIRGSWDSARVYEHLRREFAPNEPDLYADAPSSVHRPSWLGSNESLIPTAYQKPAPTRRGSSSSRSPKAATKRKPPRKK